jgi:two-component system, OmpR family, KDP operon response regulator KdpE
MIQPRRILVLSSAPERRRELVDALRTAGHAVQLMRELAGTLSPDLALVDVAAGDSWLAAELLSSGRLILIVGDPADMRRAFDLGADDCVMSDAHLEEVVARCEASLRRTARPEVVVEPDEPAIYADGRLWINFGLRQVWSGGHSAQLTAREHRLLRFLVQHADNTLSHEAILAGVWERLLEGEQPTEVLKQYIWRLRQKIEADAGKPEIIVTVPGEGYRFVSHLG